MKYDKDGNIIPEEKIETDRKFWRVYVTINSVVWESGYHIYEADSLEDAVLKYESEKEQPFDVEYTGWLDQEYRYDELDEEDPYQLEADSAEVQEILQQEKRQEEWLAEQAEKERRSKLI